GQPDSKDINIDHLQFWIGEYRSWIAQTQTKDPRVWTEALRFYARLGKLLTCTIESRQEKLTKVMRKQDRKNDEKENGEEDKCRVNQNNVGLQHEIDLLEELRAHNQLENQRMRTTFGSDLARAEF